MNKKALILVLVFVLVTKMTQVFTRTLISDDYSLTLYFFQESHYWSFTSKLIRDDDSFNLYSFLQTHYWYLLVNSLLMFTYKLIIDV